MDVVGPHPGVEVAEHVGELPLHEAHLRHPSLGGGLAEVFPHRHRDLVLALGEELLEALELGLAPGGGACVSRVEGVAQHGDGLGGVSAHGLPRDRPAGSPS